MSTSSNLPTEANHFRAYYPIWLGGLLLCIGLAICAIAIGAMLRSNSFNSLIILGAAVVLAGYLYLTQPYFVLAPSRLTVYSLLGRAVKRYPFETFDSLKIENDTLYIDGGFLEGNRLEPTQIKRRLVKSQDWKKLQAIAAA